jgi:secernin
LERHGQWGSAVQGRDHGEGSYENAFLLADRNEAWIMETTGRRWIAKRVESGCQALSNQPTIRGSWTISSPDIRDFARDMGWWKPAVEDFDFAKIFGDHEHYSRQVSHLRWKRVSRLLEDRSGEIDVSSVMDILRDHYEDTFLGGPQFTQFLPDFHTVCMHDSPNKFTWGNTATSLIVEIDPVGKKPPFLWLAYLPPCASAYIGFAWTDAFPDMLTSAGKAGLMVCPPKDAPKDEFDQKSLWWRLHRIVEAVQRDPLSRSKQATDLLRALEEKNLKKICELSGADLGKADWRKVIEDQLCHIISALETLEGDWKIT